MTHLLVLIKGGLMGIANIIPGVSGGTFALILGIYERLIASIRAFGIPTLKALLGLISGPGKPERRQAFREELRRTDALWLMILLAGAAVAILLSARLIAYLLDEQRAPTLAFFIGLILPSILVPYKLLARKGWKEALACVLGAAGLICLTVFGKPAAIEGAGLINLFIAGVIAISAMILPGVSGSFVLMVLGEYRTVLGAINTWDLLKLAVFGLGCLVGIVAFVRLLDFLLKRYHSVTVAFLIGLIIGSLWVLWPFKEVAEGAKIVTGINVLPAAFNAELGWSIGAFIVGLVCSLGMNLLGGRETSET